MDLDEKELASKITTVKFKAKTIMNNYFNINSQDQNPVELSKKKQSYKQASFIDEAKHEKMKKITKIKMVET